MSWKVAFRRQLESRGFILQRGRVTPELKDLIRTFRSSLVGLELHRVGGTSDGGYLVPDVLNNISACFSPGVDKIASFEEELANRYGIDCYLADASVSKPPVENSRFDFQQKFLGSRTEGEFITLSDWISSSLGPKLSNRLLLQMDIEGAEFDVLATTSQDVLSQFKVMIIEFHGMSRIFDPIAVHKILKIFRSIGRDFFICHVHPNNVGGIAKCGSYEVPAVMEITFIRKDVADSIKKTDSFCVPHPFDRDNSRFAPSIVMPKIWWDTNFDI